MVESTQAKGTTLHLLEGHKDSVNSLQISDSLQSPESTYLHPYSSQPILLSSSDEGQTRLWDVRTNKSVMCIQDGDACSRFMSSYLLALASGNLIKVLDLRKCSVISNSKSTLIAEYTSEEDINWLEV